MPTGLWKYFHKIEHFSEPSRYVEKDSRGDIWVSHAYRGLYKLSLSPDFKKATNIKYYDERNGLPGNYNVNLFILENRLLYSSDKGFLTFDDISNRFTRYEILNKAIGSFANSNKIINAGDKRYWFINHGKMALINFAQPGRIDIDSNQFSALDGRMVQYYENISKISDQIYLISVDDGFVIYNAMEPQSSKKISLPPVLIRKVEDITDTYLHHK